MIHVRIAAGFEQQRHIEHHHTPTRRPRPRYEPCLCRPHQRMHDRLKTQPGARIGQHHRAQRRPIQHTVRHNAGKFPRNRRQRRAATRLHPVHRRIRIEHRHTRPPEDPGNKRLAHANPAGQPYKFHVRAISAATSDTISSSTTGVTPNHAAKPGTAWCSSMPSPATQRSPRASAASSNAVRAGA